MAVNLGAGSSFDVTGDEIKAVNHGLALPSGFDLPLPAPIPIITTDYHRHFPNPGNSEYSKEIMTKGLLPKSRLISFLWLNNQKLDVVEVEKVATLYIKEASMEGVNHDIAFAQMILETGYMKFTGDVSDTQNNYCGLGAIGNGEPGLSFPDVETGIRAHIQHLKAYASTDSIKNKLVDMRFGIVKRGSAKTIQELTGRWAEDPHYDQKLDYLLKKIYAGTDVLKKKTSILFD